MTDIMQHMELKFTSGNSIPVKNTMLKVEEWYAIRDLILVLKKENERLKWQLMEQD